MLRTQTESLDEITLQRLREKDPSLTAINCAAGDVARLAEALPGNHYLKLLDIYQTVATEDAMALASILNDETTSLTEIGINISTMSANGLIALFRALQNNKTVTQLRLSGNLSDSQSNEDKMAVAESLGGMLASNQTLRWIYLEYIGYLTHGHYMTVLANGLMHNKSVKKLQIEGSAVSVDKLVDGLRGNRTLLELDLSRSINSTDDAVALAGLLNTNTTALTSIHLRGIVDNDILTPIITALKHNTTLTSLDVSDCRILYSRKLCELLVDALRINTTLLSVKYLPDGDPDDSWPDRHSSTTSSIDSFIARNKILAALSLAAKNGDAIATLDKLAELKEECPTIGDDVFHSTEPLEAIQMYEDCMVLNPSTLSPEVVATLLGKSYPQNEVIEAALDKALAYYLFTNAPIIRAEDNRLLTLPERVDENRYRLILWLLLRHLNNTEARKIFDQCAPVLFGNTFDPSTFRQQDLHQLYDVRQISTDRATIQNELTLQKIRQHDSSTSSFTYLVQNKAAAAALIDALKDNKTAESMILNYIVGEEDNVADVLKNLPKNNHTLKSISLSPRVGCDDRMISSINALRNMPAGTDIPPISLTISIDTTTAGIETLASMLKSNIAYITSLNLRKDINDDAAQALVNGLRVNKTLRSLKLLVTDNNSCIAFAGLLRSNATSLTSFELSKYEINTETLMPLFTALQDNKTLTQCKIESLNLPIDWPAIAPLLIEALKVNTRLTSIPFTKRQVFTNMQTSDLALINSFIERNKILAQLATAEENGDAIAIFDLLVQLKTVCPDIDKPASTQPTHVVQAYRDYMILHPSSLSPSVVATLMTKSYPHDIQKGLNKALALYLFSNPPLITSESETSLSLPGSVDENRYRLVLWLLRDHLHDEEVQEIIFMSAQALDANKNSLSLFNPSDLSLNQLLNIAETENLYKIIEQDKKIIFNQLGLLQQPATTVTPSAATPVTGSGHGVFDSRTTASAAAPAALVESDTTVKKPK